jgi:rhamnulokinase
MHRHLAFDLGASSGRAFIGALGNGKLDITELSRFENGMVSIRGGLYWDVVGLFQQIVRGIEAAVQACAGLGSGFVNPANGPRVLGSGFVNPANSPRVLGAGVLESIGIDTWGVDFGLLAADGSLVSLPRAYRDHRLDAAMEGFLEIVPREMIYQLTGIQLMQINTLFQLWAMVRDRWPLLGSAADLLMMPDLFNYLLTGQKRAEFTIATTSQLYNPAARAWAGELFRALGLSPEIMQEIVQPGAVVGTLDGEVARQTGMGGLPVVATASHDTAAAVAAAPGEGRDWAYISSGTWSLMGVESDRPIITPESLELNFSNEGGVGGTFRLLKNIPGLWLIQQCRQSWARDRLYSYQELSGIAAETRGFTSLIEPDHPDFLNPADMPLAIQEFCRRTGQPVPEAIADTLRCIMVSLALKYRLVLDQLRRIYPHPINRLHVIGGGARNELLCQLAADATGLPVFAGPAEATVIGNLLVQAMGMGHIASLVELREVVRSSFGMRRYEPATRPAGEPTGTAGWDVAYDRFRELTEPGGHSG